MLINYRISIQKKEGPLIYEENDICQKVQGGRIRLHGIGNCCGIAVLTCICITEERCYRGKAGKCLR